MKKRYWILIILLILVALVFVVRRITRFQAHSSSDTATSTNIISDQKIQEYLEQSNFANAYFGGKTFISFSRIQEVATSTRVTEYLWLMTQEYYKKDGVLEKGTGMSLPVAIFYDHEQPVAINIPREGSLYTSDFEKIFPDDVRKSLKITDTAVHNDMIADLQEYIEARAGEYFKMSVPSSSVVRKPQATSTPEVTPPQTPAATTSDESVI